MSFIFVPKIVLFSLIISVILLKTGFFNSFGQWCLTSFKVHTLSNGFNKSDIIKTSAKTGEGVKELLENIETKEVQKISDRLS